MSESCDVGRLGLGRITMMEVRCLGALPNWLGLAWLASSEGKSLRYDNQSFEPSQWHPSNDTTTKLCLSKTFDCTRIIRLIISILSWSFYS